MGNLKHRTHVVSVKAAESSSPMPFNPIKMATKISDCGAPPKTLELPASPHYKLYYAGILLSFLMYTFAPFFPHLLNIFVYPLTGRAQDMGKIIRYDLYWDFATKASQHIFPELTPTPLSAKHAVIMHEYDNFRATQKVPILLDLDPSHQQIVDTDKQWQTLFLRVYGVDTCYAEKFPETMKAVDESGMEAVTIMITRLAPGQVISGHVGPTKIVLRYLMALKVPDENEPRPNMQVWSCDHPNCPNHHHVWTHNGQEFMFDDTFWHASENPSSQERVVLWLDVKRPDIRGWRERLINNIVLAVIRALPVARKADIIANSQKMCAQSLIGLNGS